MHFRFRRDRTRGQAMVEFALVAVPLLIILMGILQFGLLFWGQITLTQVGRDTGRWAATQTACDTSVGLAAQANAIADQSLLVGHGSSNQVVVSAPAWTVEGTGTVCPPPDNTEVWWVSFELTYQAPVFIPLIPVDGVLSTDVRYRMEPAP